MFPPDTVSKCVCSGLRKLMNYTGAALRCHGVSALHLPFVCLFCLVSVVCGSPGPASARRGCSGTPCIVGARGLIEQLLHICSPSCPVICGGSLTGDVVHRTCTLYPDQPFALQVSEAAYQCLQRRRKDPTRVCVSL